MAVFVFVFVLSVFAAYMVGKSTGYKDAISNQEQKKGIRQNSRMLYNKRF